MFTTFRKLGINVDFAPILNILNRVVSAAIGNQFFGRNLNSVTEHSGGLVVGLHLGGVLGC
ncbi:MAG: hypothetical protein EOP04_32055 [Proteobacteria bacterium]|nr:MAG: hypothetical protein EOP04_32055 [Pseudomonadota bacterium]